MAGLIVLGILATVLALLVTVVWWAVGNAWEKRDREARARWRGPNAPPAPRSDRRVTRDP
ncbi:MAG: hypothetical protein H6810_12210 [Phycisphaeraceae bacterium]|nr:MAG: hypothetical protein H6810_12210 [Phycisphaeraceae bacterium]